MRFHFLSLPPVAKTVEISWRTPSFTFVGKVSGPRRRTSSSNLCVRTQALPKGTWYATLTVAGKTAKRVEVHVT